MSRTVHSVSVTPAAIATWSGQACYDSPAT